jgi:ATP-dependent protease HslVU (ClpYQ) peptidase subunit
MTLIDFIQRHHLSLHTAPIDKLNAIIRSDETITHKETVFQVTWRGIQRLATANGKVVTFSGVGLTDTAALRNLVDNLNKHIPFALDDQKHTVISDPIEQKEVWTQDDVWRLLDVGRRG